MSRIEEARKAYEKKDLEGIKWAHDKDRITAEPWHNVSGGRYIKDVVYGASDGMLTSFAVVAGATGALLSSTVVLILGLTNLLADGFSMAAGDYLGTRSEMEYARKERERETMEVAHMPDGETEEIRQIFRKKGLAFNLADKLAEIITSDKKVWIDVMMTEELGIIPNENLSPMRSALATFLAFVCAGFMPLLFFVLSYAYIITNVFALSAMTTGLSLFIVGALRAKVTRRNWLRSGLEMLIVGGAAAAVAYGVGYLLRTLVG